MPDPCLVIVVGVLAGLIIRFATDGDRPLSFNQNTFFIYLLAFIPFDAGYNKADNHMFMENIVSILLNTLLGTLIATFAMGFIFYFAAKTANFEISIIESLVG